MLEVAGSLAQAQSCYDVRFGPDYVCFTPKSGHSEAHAGLPLMTHSRSTGDRQQGEERLAEAHRQSRAGRAWDVYTALDALGAVGGRRSQEQLEQANGGPKATVRCRNASYAPSAPRHEEAKPGKARSEEGEA